MLSFPFLCSPNDRVMFSLSGEFEKGTLSKYVLGGTRSYKLLNHVRLYKFLNLQVLLYLIYGWKDLSMNCIFPLQKLVSQIVAVSCRLQITFVFCVLNFEFRKQNKKGSQPCSSSDLSHLVFPLANDGKKKNVPQILANDPKAYGLEGCRWM